MSTPDAIVLRASNLPESHRAVEMSGTRTLDDGTPVRLFWKPLLRPGSFEHPKLGKLNFTRDYLADVDRNTRQFIADGGKPYVPLGHSNKTNMGWIRDTNFDGETLYGLHEMIGADAILAAQRNDSSVCIRNNYVGGNGKRYGPLLEHNCLTPEPVAMGLGDFVALSRDASGGPGEAVPIYSPAAEGHHPMTPEQLQMSREILGQPDLPEADALEQIIGAARLAADYYNDLETNKVELARTSEEVETLKTRLATQMVEMSRATSPPRPSASELHWASRAVQAEKDKAIRAGAITPAVAAKAEERFLRKPVDFSKVTLDREVEDDDHKIASGLAQLMAFYETVQGNTPRQRAGEVTGRQETIPMDRSVPGNDGAGGGNEPDRQAELLKQQLGLNRKTA